MATRGVIWEDNKINSLIVVWKEDEIQRQSLKTTHKNSNVFDRVDEMLSGVGIVRTGTQCHTQIKKLITKYTLTKDKVRRSGEKADYIVCVFIPLFPYREGRDKCVSIPQRPRPGHAIYRFARSLYQLDCKHHNNRPDIKPRDLCTLPDTYNI